jgi:hypothetical protein
MTERRRVQRRTIPFLRGGVLNVDGQSHIVTIVDLSSDGAYLATRVDVPEGADLRLTTVLPRSGRQVTLPCEVVWRSERFEADTARPAGMAIRFLRKEPAVHDHLESISAEGLFPAPIGAVRDRLEYRVIEKAEIDVDELNHLGRDGWALATALPAAEVVRLVFYRRM